MSTQYRDGSFSDVRPFNEAMEKFMEACEANTAKAFHVGTKEEIENVISERSTKERLDLLENNLNALRSKINANKIIDIPTFNEVQLITNKE